ncbi:tripartite tricarboxylate transporter TctB family protein [Arthrobacter nitrophenolicus]|uniref:Tripartite tricarboxylate transporter TctB family protein n=1 Tax=Arthrobacter nitrophenolicus TaxID=683150 RepID=A0A4R5Y7C7_9MICC|nr:tripartite tricarboxylate transporter TctB family protein [Arthrobacter nitrophenolicus]TDL39686.1 tripartite tricarboxylate transporter TctB family protein [Arthrobacter nitrophenolicus]
MSTSVPEANTPVEDSLAVELGEPVRRHLPRKFGLNAWTANLAAAANTVIIGVVVFLSASGFGYGTPAKPGAGVFPAAIAAMFVILGAVWLLQCITGVVAASVEDENQTDEIDELCGDLKVSETTPGALRRLGWASSPAFRIIVTILVMVAFGMLVDILGYQLTMLLAMALLLHLVAGSRWFITLLLSAAMAFGTFAIFSFGLGVPLPVAGIGFLQELGL